MSFLDTLKRTKDGEDNMIFPFVVNVERIRDTRTEWMRKAYIHLEKGILKFLLPNFRPDNRLEKDGLKRYHCRVPGCDYKITVEYVAIIDKFLSDYDHWP